MHRVVVAAGLAVAFAVVRPSPSRAEPLALTSEWGAGLNYARWDGPYTSQGVGGRFRWEPHEYFGLEVTGEVLGSSGGFEVPVGFQLYVPVTIAGPVRVRPMAGLCVNVQMSRSATVETSAGDDIQFGFRLGAGTEVALSDRFWLFADAKWERYLGHSRKVSVWSNALDGDLAVADRLALAIGIGLAL